MARLPIGEEKFQFYQTLDPLDLEMLQNRITDRLGGGFASESEEEDSLVSSASESEDSEEESASKVRLATTSRGAQKEELLEEGMTRIQFKNARKEKKKERKVKEQSKELKAKAKAVRLARRESHIEARKKLIKDALVEALLRKELQLLFGPRDQDSALSLLEKVRMPSGDFFAEKNTASSYIAEFDRVLVWIGEGQAKPRERDIGRQFLGGIYPRKLRLNVELKGYKSWYNMARYLYKKYLVW